MTDEADKTRRILLASYWYPPAIGAAAERIGAFARHLPNHGWSARVLTSAREASSSRVSGVEVRGVADPLAGSGRPFADYDPRRKPSRLREFLRGFVFPDRFVAWQKAAFQAGCEWLQREKTDVILASFPPASVAVLGLRLHQASGVPLVIDFRDRWFGPGGYEPASRRVRKKHEEVQREVVGSAAAIVVVSQTMADAVVAEHGIDPARVWVIPNGYEPWQANEHVQGPADRGADPAKPLILSHVGTVIPRNRPDLFFASLGRILDDPTIQNIRFRFVGNLSSDYLATSGLNPIVEATGLLPRDQARREMQEADALLLLTGKYVGTWGHNAKLFEYLQTSRPILCLEESPGSHDRKLLEELAPERSFFAAIDDAAGIVDQMNRLKAYAKAPCAGSNAASAGLERYARPRLVTSLAEHLVSLG